MNEEERNSIECAEIRLDERIKTLKEILRRIKNGDNV